MDLNPNAKFKESDDFHHVAIFIDKVLCFEHRFSREVSCDLTALILDESTCQFTCTVLPQPLVDRLALLHAQTIVVLHITDRLWTTDWETLFERTCPAVFIRGIREPVVMDIRSYFSIVAPPSLATFLARNSLAKPVQSLSKNTRATAVHGANEIGFQAQFVAVTSATVTWANDSHRKEVCGAVTVLGIPTESPFWLDFYRACFAGDSLGSALIAGQRQEPHYRVRCLGHPQDQLIHPPRVLSQKMKKKIYALSVAVVLVLSLMQMGDWHHRDRIACLQGKGHHCLVYGQGLPAIEQHDYFARACGLRDGHGCFALGSIHDAQGKQQSAKEAYRMACSYEDGAGCYNLALSLPENVQAELLRKACHLKNGPACFNLALTATEVRVAQSWYEKSCFYREGQGCYNLAIQLFQSAAGVVEILKKSHAYFGRACKLAIKDGCHNAQIVRGLLSEKESL